ncbi:MAG: MotA/TolQ/ExbB proton channel family protein [Halobacteriota archaeon]
MDIATALKLFDSGAQSGIYLISTSLLYPVIIVLFILIAWSLIALGGFLYEWHRRNRDFVSLERGAFKARALLDANELDGAFGILSESCSSKFVHIFLSRISEFKGVFQSKKLTEVKVEKLLQDLESSMAKRLEKSRFATRAGPMLGLMGTLIPMGPALLALAGGDIEMLAKNLIIAFGTTVLGLAAGLVGNVTLMVRGRWYEQDMSDMEYLSEILFGDRESEEGFELALIEECGVDTRESRSQRLRHCLSKVKRGERGKRREVLKTEGGDNEI